MSGTAWVCIIIHYDMCFNIESQEFRFSHVLTLIPYSFQVCDQSATSFLCPSLPLTPGPGGIARGILGICFGAVLWGKRSRIEQILQGRNLCRLGSLSGIVRTGPYWHAHGKGPGRPQCNAKVEVLRVTLTCAQNMTLHASIRICLSKEVN